MPDIWVEVGGGRRRRLSVESRSTWRDHVRDLALDAVREAVEADILEHDIGRADQRVWVAFYDTETQTTVSAAVCVESRLELRVVEADVLP